VVTTGLVVFNCGNGKRIIDSRLAAAARESRFGTAAPPGSRDTTEFLNVRLWQPMLMHKDAAKHAARASLVRRNLAGLVPEPFASFNLFSREHSKEQVERDHVFLSLAGDNFVYNEPSQKDIGLAAIVAGSCTIVNTGVTRITPGMLLAWEAYPMRATESDERELAAFNHTRAQLGAISPEHKVGYYPVRIEEFNEERVVRHYVADVMKQFLGIDDAVRQRQLLDFSRIAHNTVDEDGQPMPHDEYFFMSRVRADLLVVAASILKAGGTVAAAAAMARGSDPTTFMFLRMLHGAEIGKPVELDGDDDDSRYLNAAFAKTGTDTVDLVSQAIYNATRRCIGRAGTYALPNGTVDVVL
jgi:hypothetical protein